MEKEYTDLCARISWKDNAILLCRRVDDNTLISKNAASTIWQIMIRADIIGSILCQ